MEMITLDASAVGVDLRPAEADSGALLVDAPAEAPAPAPPPPAHLITELNRGSFTYMSCATCGWDGPARRAQASADRDAQRHESTKPIEQ